MVASWWRWASLTLVVLMLGHTWPARAASPGSTSPTDRALLFGIAGHAWWLEEHLDTFVAAYRDLGVTTVRLSVDWKYIEPTPGIYRWERYDRVLRRLADERLTLVGVFVTVPPWAATDPAACAVELNEPKACDLRREHYPAFERVARAMLIRYPFIRSWEFWNEPDQWTHVGRIVDDYLPWLARFYAVAKEVDPAIQVAASTLAGWEYLGWLYDVSDATLGTRPWDAIAFHPYNTREEMNDQGELLPIRFREIEQIRAQMIARGDERKPLWITEYGWDQEPAIQATQLGRAMRWMLTRDYITMAHLHMLHDWERERYGLLRTVPDVYGVGSIDATTRFVPKAPYYGAFKRLPRLDPPPASPDQAIFPTGQLIAPIFRPTWERHGVPTFGLPLTQPFWERRPSGDYALVQYFERARLEWTRADGVQLGLLGAEALRARGWLDADGQPLADATRPRPEPGDEEVRYFPETGHGLSGAFRRAWEVAGGVGVLGFPRTAVLTEEAPSGATLLIQYTERARLEQAVTADGPGPVMLGRLGAEAIQARGWLDAAGQPTPVYLNPARRAVR